MNSTKLPEELAWAAGFFDGEGHVGKVSAAGSLRRSRSIRVNIPQIHPYVLERFARVVGVGTVKGPIALKPPRNPQWRYVCSNFEHIQHIMAVLWKWLSPVKREQFKKAIEEWKAQGGRNHYAPKSKRLKEYKWLAFVA